MEKYWEILGISQTKDLDVLKNAYREKLILVNPEDDPEGFKVLRNAYEEAVKWAKAEEPLIQKDESPLGEWIQQVEEVYSYFPKRNSIKCWKELLDYDICIGLDTANQARDKLLGFLMSHFRLSYGVWELIERQFHLVEDKKELYERYPKNFIDYVLNNIAYPGFLDFELFEGEEDGAYDEFIEQFFQLRAAMDEGKDPLPAMDKLRDMNVYHPYLDMEYVRYQINQKNWQEAKAAIDKLTSKYPEDLYILYFEAKINWGMEEYEKAYQGYTKILDQNPSYFSARIGVAEYYQHIGKFGDAKELYLDLLDSDSQNTYLLEQMRAVNEVLIDEYTEKLEHDSQDIGSALELGWCLFQNERYQEVIQILDQHQPDEENYFHYHNLKGRAYLLLEEYEKALEHLSIWLEEIKKLKEDGTEKTSKRIKRLGYAYYTLFNVYSNLPDHDGENKKKAMEYLEQAIEVETAPGSQIMYLQAKTRMLLQIEAYQKCVDVCNQLIERDSNYYPAYVTRQEAYFKLEYYKNVIEDYYRATEIYSYHIVPYLWAIKTYWIYRDYEAGIKAVDRAKECKLQSNEMTLYQIRFLRCLAKTKEETVNVLNLCQELKKQIESDDNDLEDESEVYFESGLCLMDIRKYEEALIQINKAIALDSSKDNYYYVKGNIYLEQRKYEEALHIYQVLNTNQPDNSVILFRMGEAYCKKGDTNTAITYFEKVLALDSEHRTVNHELMEIYQDRWENKEKAECYEKAVYYATKQLEITPSDYYYIERGLLYLNNDAFEEAEADFMKAASINPDNLFAYNNIGMVYRNRGQYEKAIEWFEKAVEKLDFDNSMLPYGNMGECYEALHQYDKALKCHKDNLELFPKRAAAYASVAEILRTMKRYDESLGYLQKGILAPDANELFFLFCMGSIYEDQGLGKKAIEIYKQALKKEPKSKKAYQNLGHYHYFISGKYKKALKYYMAGLEIAEISKDSYYRDFCFYIGILWKDLKKEDKAIKYLSQAIDSYNLVYGSVDNYLAFKGYQPSRYYRIGRIYYCMGDIDKAKEYFSKMAAFRLCDKCSYGECYELLEAEALICEAEGNISRAIELYTKAEKISVANHFAAKKIRELKKKKR